MTSTSFSLLKDANVPEREIVELREYFLAANLLPAQVGLLERMLTSQGIEASTVREAASKLLELRNPVELYKYLEPLAKPLDVDKKIVQNLLKALSRKPGFWRCFVADRQEILSTAAPGH